MRQIVLFVVAAVTSLTMSGSAGSAGSVQARWVISDLGRLAGTWVGIGEGGAVVWQGADGHGRVWQSGKTRDLGTLGGRYSAPQAVNRRGQVVGWSATRLEAGTTTWHAFLWENGRMRDLGTLGGRASYATAINDRGEVVGWAEKDRREHFAYGALFTPGDVGKHAFHGGTRHAFVWRGGTMHDLGTLGGEESYAAALNESGQAAGRSQTGDDLRRAFLWRAGRLVDLGDLGCGESDVSAMNAKAQVVGESCNEQNGIFSYLWRGGRIRPLSIEYPLEITDRGQVLGVDSLWENGRTVRLDFSAADMNERGEVVGALGGAVLWRNGTTTNLGGLAGGTRSAATAINDHGQIVGWATATNGQKHAVLWTLRSG